MRITAKGQVTIPVEIREQFGLLPETEVDFVVDEGGVRLVPVAPTKGEGRGQRAIRRLRAHRNSAGRALTTDEIMKLTRG